MYQTLHNNTPLFMGFSHEVNWLQDYMGGVLLKGKMAQNSK
jgi:hypothetical protein